MVGRSLLGNAMAGVLLLALALCGCESDLGDGKAADAGDAGKGDAVLSFTAKSSVQKAKFLVDPLKGAVYGNLFLTEDVTVAGPINGAEQFGSIDVLGLDLQGEGKVDGAFTTPKLAPGNYTFLGFFDVDDNGATSHDPDPGDPVTLAITNHFIIEAGKTTAYTVTFDLVYN
jgi:hypothetical protein